MSVQVDDKRCKTCGSRSEPLYDQEASKMTWLITALSCVFLGFWSFMVIPLIIQATKTMVKRCYDCNEVLERHELFSIPSFNDKVANFNNNIDIKFQIWELRNYSFEKVCVCNHNNICSNLLYIWIQQRRSYITTEATNQQLNFQNQNIDIYQNNNWTQYLNDCGKDVFISNGVKAKSNYIKFYENKIISWSGAFMLQKESNKLLRLTRNGLYIKMIPTDTQGEIPDLVLAVEDELWNQYIQTINNLKVGQMIEFQASLEHFGDEFSYHAGRLISMQETDQMVDLQNIEQFENINIL